MCVWNIIKSDRNVSVSASLDWFLVDLAKWRKWRNKEGMWKWRSGEGKKEWDIRQISLKMICTIKLHISFNGNVIHESSRLGPGKTGTLSMPSVPEPDRTRSARLAARLCFCQQRSWKWGSRKKNKSDHSARSSFICRTHNSTSPQGGISHQLILKLAGMLKPCH